MNRSSCRCGAEGRIRSATPKFLPLIGLVVGKLAELFINHEIQKSANRYKAGRCAQGHALRGDQADEPVSRGLRARPGAAYQCQVGLHDHRRGQFQARGDRMHAPLTCRRSCRQRQHRQAAEPNGRPRRTDDSIENQLRRANICIEGKARAVYEARFEFSKDGTAYRLNDAGFRIDTLLTTEKPGATRTTLYTLKISNPSATDQQEVLSSAWVNIGTVAAGARSHGRRGCGALAARSAPVHRGASNLRGQNRVQQQVTGEIQALQRALTRNERMLADLDRRIVGAPPIWRPA